MKEYNSIYLGIVIQNNDPKKRGRVKVYVPSISPTVNTEFNVDNNNKSFSGINSDILPILKDLKKNLPWAETASPLVGEGASGRFNNYTNRSSVSDANNFDNFNQDNTASSGELYDQSVHRLNDAFSDTDKNINNINPYSYMYKPNTYSNKAKGSFAIPSVGAHVYVFFREGDSNFPVILASAYGRSDWQGIYDNEVDYPGKFENFDSSLTELDENVKTYRNKYVLNQKGGTIEIGNTDQNEKVRLTQYSGSFKEMNNHTNIELATKNDQKLVLGDSFDTTKGFRNIYTSKNLDEIVLRDKYKKVGNLNYEIYEQWKELFGTVQDSKQLFPTKRANNNDKTNASGNTVVSLNSKKQSKSGQNELFPVTQKNVVFGLDNVNTLESSVFQTINTVASIGGNFLIPVIESMNNVSATRSIPKRGQRRQSASTPGLYPIETGLSLESFKLSPSTAGGDFAEDENYKNINDQIVTQLENLMELEKDMGLGGNEFVEIAKNKVENIGMVMNDYGSIRLDPFGKLISSEMIVGSNGVYTNQEAAPLIEYVDVQDMPGGTYNLNATNKYNLLVGAGGMNLKSYGPANIVGSITNIAGEQVNIGTQNDINIDGDVVDISANILKLRNKRNRQIYVDGSIGVKNNIVIGGGLHVEGELSVQHITAPSEIQVTNDTKVFGQPTRGQAFSCVLGFLPVGAQLVGQFVGPGGSGFASFILARPGSIVTNSVDAFRSNTSFGPFPDQNSIETYAHEHSFNNIPLTLTDGNRSVRHTAVNARMSHGCNVPASSQHNTLKSGTEIKLTKGLI